MSKLIKTPSSKIVLRQTTAVPQKRSEIEALLTRDGVARFLTTMGRGAVEAHITPAETGSSEKNESATDAAGEKLKLGDTVTVSLPTLEFQGLTGLAQMMLGSKAPEKVKSYIEKSPVFEKVGAGLDVAYGFLRDGLTFSSKITEMSSTAEALTYVDEGVELPKVLKSWRHTHKISANGEGGLIIDELEVEVDPALAAPVIEGALRLHLESRAKAYKNLASS